MTPDRVKNYGSVTRGTVVDAGGDEVIVLLDRDTQRQSPPEKGNRVALTVTGFSTIDRHNQRATERHIASHHEGFSAGFEYAKRHYSGAQAYRAGYAQAVADLQQHFLRTMWAAVQDVHRSLLELDSEIILLRKRFPISTGNPRVDETLGYFAAKEET